jgi:predicted acetyltransferase
LLNTIQIELCEKNNQQTIENLTQFYYYDLSQLSKHANIHLMKEGLFEKILHLSKYWEEKDRHPYLIKQANLPIGFALIHNLTINKEADWTMAEFFILAPYRKKGVGRHVIKSIFKQFPGFWEIAVFKDNHVAQEFWRNILPSSAPHRYYETHPQFIVYETKII